MPDKPGAGADDWDSVETRQHILARTRGLRVVTDDNIGTRMAPALEATVDYRTIKACGKGAVNLRRISSAQSETLRVAELKAAQAQKSELSRDQLREFLTEVILTPASKVNEQSRLCQSYKVTPEVREIRMPDKLRAVEQLAKLCGFNEPEKMEIEHWIQGAARVVEVIARLRGRGAVQNNQCAG